MIYTAEFQEKALQLVDDIGVKKASKELHVAEQTLYNWRKKAQGIEKLESTDLDKINPSTETNNLCVDLDQKIDEYKRLNSSCQQTIQYLVEENTALRQQCENYLAAIRLITQR